MKVNIGYLNCYDSILGPNLIKIFITPNIKCVFSEKVKKSFYIYNKHNEMTIMKNQAQDYGQTLFRSISIPSLSTFMDSDRSTGVILYKYWSNPIEVLE